MKKIDHLEDIEKRALKIIDNRSNLGCTYEALLCIYGHTKLCFWRKDHHLSVMYRHASDCVSL